MPIGFVARGEIERVVVDQIRCIGRDPGLIKEVLVEARVGVEREMAALRLERTDLARELVRHHAELRRLALSAGTEACAARILALQELTEAAEGRGPEIDLKIALLQRERIEEAEAMAAFGDFELAWGQLSPKEQARLLSLLVARIAYDAVGGTVAVSFHVTGIKGLAQQITTRRRHDHGDHASSFYDDVCGEEEDACERPAGANGRERACSAYLEADGAGNSV
jgi:site-specific DNA recombinase